MRRVTRFFAELKRRRVYQVAAVYAAAAFVAAQAAEIFLPRLGLPDWTVTFVVVAAVAGFPVAVILGWVFDITPTGVRRTEELPPESPPPPVPGRGRAAGGAALAVLVLAAGGWWLGGIAFGPAPAIGSVAVLPFENLTGDPDQEYFVAGMHDALISELSRIGALHVISRTSVRRFRESDLPPPRIGRELGAAGLIEGTVYREADRVRVSVRLIHAASERQVWDGTFERELRGILALHSDMARAIAAEVRVALAPAEPAAAAIDPEAYDRYLRGRFHWQQLSEEGLERSLAYFSEAIALDPDWALPYAGLSDAYHRMGDSQALPHDVAFPRAREAALAALERDPRSAEAHLSLASVKFHWEWDWPGADSYYRRAIALNPNYAIALRWYSLYLRALGRYDEALEYAEKAFLLDPLDPLARTAVPYVLLSAGRYDEAIERLAPVMEADPGHPAARRDLGRAFLAKGDVARAIPLLEEHAAARPSARTDVDVAIAYARAGRLAEARPLADRLERDASTRPPTVLDLAALRFALGDGERALAILESAYEERDASLPEVAAESRLFGLHGEPRFQALLERLGLPGDAGSQS